MKNIFITGLFILMSLAAYSQQESQYTQFMYNAQYYNPAYVGSRGIPSLTALYRKQWLGYAGAPTSQLLSYNGKFIADRVGFGIQASHHEIGIMNTWYFSLAYSYGLVQTEDLNVRLGMHGSIRNFRVNFADPANIILNDNDPSVPDMALQANMKGNVGVGLYVNYKGSYFGLSVPNLYSNNLGFNTTSLISAELSQHFYAMGGLLIPAGKSLDIKPAVLVKYVKNAPLDVDMNLSLLFNKKVSAGASYRLGGNGSGESIDFLVFFQASDQLGIGAAYDFTLSDLKDQQSGSIEVMMRYDLKKDKKVDMTNPRFFF
jgi:type IX secretion system PorP/SprF family membrane protein